MYKFLALIMLILESCTIFPSPVEVISSTGLEGPPQFIYFVSSDIGYSFLMFKYGMKILHSRLKAVLSLRLLMAVVLGMNCIIFLKHRSSRFIQYQDKTSTSYAL